MIPHYMGKYSCCNRHLHVVIDSTLALQGSVDELFIVHGHVKCGFCIIDKLLYGDV